MNHTDKGMSKLLHRITYISGIFIYRYVLQFLRESLCPRVVCLGAVGFNGEAISTVVLSAV